MPFYLLFYLKTTKQILEVPTDTKFIISLQNVSNIKATNEKKKNNKF